MTPSRPMPNWPRCCARSRLTGMLETLDARLAEARAGTLGHVEFLQVLCEDELARRDAAAVSRRLRSAHLPSAATLEGFDFSYNPKLPAAQIRDLARLEFVAAGEGALHLRAGRGRQDPRGGRPGPPGLPTRLRRHVHDLPAACWPSWPAATPTAASPPGSRRLAKPALLVVDDFAMRDFSRAQPPTIFTSSSASGWASPATAWCLTSNRSPADWYPLFPNAVVGESVLDRVINTSHHLLMDGKSYRPNRRPGRGTKTDP